MGMFSHFHSGKIGPKQMYHRNTPAALFISLLPTGIPVFLHDHHYINKLQIFGEGSNITQLVIFSIFYWGCRQTVKWTVALEWSLVFLTEKIYSYWSLSMRLRPPFNPAMGQGLMPSLIQTELELIETTNWAMNFELMSLWGWSWQLVSCIVLSAWSPFLKHLTDDG